MTHSLDTSQPLSPVTPVLAQWLINKVAKVAVMEVTPGLSNMDFHSPRLAWPQPLMSTQAASVRDQYRDPNMTSALVAC